MSRRHFVAQSHSNLRQLLSAWYFSSCFFFFFSPSYLPTPPIQLPALIGLNFLWLNLLIQNSYYCCSSVSGFPSLHSFGIFQTSCCCYQNESCWQALFDTCKIQCMSSLIRKQRRQEKWVKSLCQNIPLAFQLPSRLRICPFTDTINIFLFSAFLLPNLFSNTEGTKCFPQHVIGSK